MEIRFFFLYLYLFLSIFVNSFLLIPTAFPIPF